MNDNMPVSGYMLNDTGEPINIVDVLGGGTPLSDTVYDVASYAPHGGRVLGSDGKAYSLVELLTNAGGNAQIGSDVLEQLAARTEDVDVVARLDGLIGGLPLEIVAKCVAQFTGSGDGPSFDNPWTLVGRNQLVITRCGRNLLDLVNRVGSDAGGTRTQLPDGFRQTVVTPGNVSSTYHLPLSLLGKTVTLSFDWMANGDVAGERVWIHFGKGSNSTVSSVATPLLTGSHVTVTATIPDALPEGTEWLAVRFYTNYSNASVTAGSYCEFTNIMLEIGENESPYEPYHGDRYAFILPEMVYGTEEFPTIIDCVRGIVSVQEVGIVLTGNENWVLSSSGESTTFRLAIAGKSDRTHGRCSHYPTSYASPVSTTGQMYTPGTASSPNMILIRPDLSSYPDLASFKEMLVAQYAAGTPVVCTWLQPKNLAIDASVVPALPGFNTAYSDGSREISLDGRVTAQWMYSELVALKKMVAALTP